MPLPYLRGCVKLDWQIGDHLRVQIFKCANVQIFNAATYAACRQKKAQWQFFPDEPSTTIINSKIAVTRTPALQQKCIFSAQLYHEGRHAKSLILGLARRKICQMQICLNGLGGAPPAQAVSCYIILNYFCFQELNILRHLNCIGVYQINQFKIPSTYLPYLQESTTKDGFL